jgi:hypothetical protein
MDLEVRGCQSSDGDCDDGDGSDDQCDYGIRGAPATATCVSATTFSSSPASFVETPVEGYGYAPATPSIRERERRPERFLPCGGLVPRRRHEALDDNGGFAMALAPICGLIAPWLGMPASSSRPPPP